MELTLGPCPKGVNGLHEKLVDWDSMEHDVRFIPSPFCAMKVSTMDCICEDMSFQRWILCYRGGRIMWNSIKCVLQVARVASGLTAFLQFDSSTFMSVRRCVMSMASHIRLVPKRVYC